MSHLEYGILEENWNEVEEGIRRFVEWYQKER
jgi:hypothetical protein